MCRPRRDESRIARGGVRGWAVCLSEPAGWELVAAGESFSPTQDRPDVAKWYKTSDPRYARCGFDLSIPYPGPGLTLSARAPEREYKLFQLKVPPMQSEAHNLPDNSLGYFFNRGGLNNQKLALFGLFLKAYREGPRRIVLPNFIIFDQVTFNHLPISIERAFEVDQLRDFAARHGIEVVDAPPGGDHGGWDYFHYGNYYIPRAALLHELGRESFTCDFFRSVVPKARSLATLLRLSRVAKQRNIRRVVQMRIENDWDFHITHRLKPVVGSTEDNALTFYEIIEKLKRTLPDESSGIYVVCDEAALPVPKEEIRHTVKQQFAIDLFWKTDLLTEDELRDLSLLDLSLLDFEMAVAIDTFVGLTRSTFSNMVTLEKYARTRVSSNRHYIYNLKGPKLALRKDVGAFSYPELASAGNPWDTAHIFQLAEIFRASGERHRALELYNERAALSGENSEEIYLSLYRAAEIKAELGFPPALVIDSYSRATAAFPMRAEAAYGASRYCRLKEMYKEGYEIAARAIHLPVPKEGRFVEPWIYEWALLDEYAVNASWIGRYNDCLNACRRMLAGAAPAEHRERIQANANFALERLDGNTLSIA